MKKEGVCKRRAYLLECTRKKHKSRGHRLQRTKSMNKMTTTAVSHKPNRSQVEIHRTIKSKQEAGKNDNDTGKK